MTICNGTSNYHVKLCSVHEGYQARAKSHYSSWVVRQALKCTRRTGTGRATGTLGLVSAVPQLGSLGPGFPISESAFLNLVGSTLPTGSVLTKGQGYLSMAISSCAELITGHTAGHQQVLLGDDSVAERSKSHRKQARLSLVPDLRETQYVQNVPNGAAHLTGCPPCISGYR